MTRRRHRTPRSLLPLLLLGLAVALLSPRPAQSQSQAQAPRAAKAAPTANATTTTATTTTAAPRISSSTADRREFTTSPALSTEARILVQLLSQAHYNRDTVRSSSYIEVIKDYMSALDGQRMFFLKSDRDLFEKKHSTSLYWNVSRLGNIDAAYEIFSRYELRAHERVDWIFRNIDAALADLDSDDHHRIDRRKVEWPDSPAEADSLWLNRLKFELIAELLNKRSPEKAAEAVRTRYERLLKNLAETETSDVGEMFLATIARLYDPHTAYLSGDTFEDFNIQLKLELVGIGALLTVEDDYCVVKELVPGGPAALGGELKANDKIISVAQGEDGDFLEIIGLKLRKIVDQIRGEKGSTVRLLVQPGDATDPAARREVLITRDTVKLNSARAYAGLFQVPTGEHIAAPSGDATDHSPSTARTAPIGVITLPSFYGAAEEGGPDGEENSSATHDVARLIAQLQAQGIQGLVLDLRGNGGGLLNEAIDITGLFIPRGPVVQVKSYSGEIRVSSDESPTIAYTGPLAVLVDHFSASASEIVAGALQNYGRAIIIGDRSTHGKGSVQALEEMRRYVPQLARSGAKTGATKFTVQKYYLPNGDSTQRKGVVPDIILPSIEDHLPIGEAELPRALAWDEIPSTFFDGAPIDDNLLATLRDASLARQNSLEEFDYLRRNIDWFKQRQDEKLVSVNLEKRRARRDEDKALRKAFLAERKRLAALDYAYEEFWLSPPEERQTTTATKNADGTASVEIDEAATDAADDDALLAEADTTANVNDASRAEPANDSASPTREISDTLLASDGTEDSPASDDDDDLEEEEDDTGAYAKVDVHLKESLRVVADVIALGHDPSNWIHNAPPLTARTTP
ncbi:carboxy terminal-processing peptidase [Cephaloticoccus capnophilus]|nr:carboxy terminal-processing peptidase [Cephaloticoccus capnophilus]